MCPASMPGLLSSGFSHARHHSCMKSQLILINGLFARKPIPSWTNRYPASKTGRAYAIRSKSKSVPNPTSSRPRNSKPEEVLPKSRSTPSIEIFQKYVTEHKVTSVTAEQLWNCCQLYVKDARPEIELWESTFVRGRGFSAQLLHQAGWILLFGTRDKDYMVLALRMAYSASMLDHTPAILCLVRYLRGKGRFPGSGNARLQSKFAEIVSQKRDPDAMTLHGMILQDSGKTVEALAAFRLAYKLSQDGKHLNWAPACYLGLGKCLRGLGKHEEAKTWLEKAAFEYDDASSYFHLGMAQDSTNVELQFRYLTKAAANGVSDAWKELATWNVDMSWRPEYTRNAQEISKEAAEWRRVYLPENHT